MDTEARARPSTSELPLRSVAAGEVKRLRAMRSQLRGQRDAIDRELSAIDDLLKTLVSYDPSLRSVDDIRRPRARRLGVTLAEILTDHPNQWFTMADLAGLVAEQMPVTVSETSLRNALYHLVKTRDKIVSRDGDQGIQYSYSDNEPITRDNIMPSNPVRWSGGTNAGCGEVMVV